jgi:hypothetical protein
VDFLELNCDFQGWGGLTEGLVIENIPHSTLCALTEGQAQDARGDPRTGDIGHSFQSSSYIDMHVV